MVYVLVDECELEDGTQHPSGVGDPSIPDGDERVVYGILKGPESWSPFTVQVCVRGCVVVVAGILTVALRCSVPASVQVCVRECVLLLLPGFLL